VLTIVHDTHETTLAIDLVEELFCRYQTTRIRGRYYTVSMCGMITRDVLYNPILMVIDGSSPIGESVTLDAQPN
jgi:hypothetical protein